MTTAVVRLSDGLRQQIIDHCLAARPNEGCGLLAMDADTIPHIYPTANELDSPTGYTIPPQEHIDALLDAEAQGWRLGGVFHSHPTGSGVPSHIDVHAALDPDWVYLVVGLEGEPEVRAWQIRDAEVVELPLA